MEITDEQIAEFLKITDGDLIFTSVIIGASVAELRDRIEGSKVLQDTIASLEGANFPVIDVELQAILEGSSPSRDRGDVKNVVADQELAECLLQAQGDVVQASIMAGITATEFSERLKRSDVIQESQEEVGADGLVFDPHELIPAIKNQEPWAITYWLSNYATDRGYSNENGGTESPESERESI